jgi:1-acyl-sn-glycerol-3-phosphate acyltransferase
MKVVASASAPRYHRSWMAYFFFMIALVGAAIGYGIGAPLLLLGRVFPKARRAGERVFRRGIALLMRLEPWLDARYEIALVPGAMTVANHRSHLDAFLLLSRIAGIRIVCKHSLFYIPGLSVAMRLMRHIPVRRGDSSSYWRAMEQVREGLRNQEAVHVFPEMTRCEPGLGGTQPFHLAPFHVAFQEKVKVIPIAIQGTDQVWPKGLAKLSWRRPVRVTSLAPLDPRDFRSASDLAAETRRRIDAFLSLSTSGAA